MKAQATIPSVARERSAEQGFTLVELMIAMTLAAVLVGMITVVSISAQRLYDETTARVEVLQNARLATNDIRSALEKAQPTADLEFYIDKPGGRLNVLNNHWDDNEEIRDSATVKNLEGGRPNFYDEGAHIIERYYLCTETQTTHANFSIYFRASLEIDGEIRPANVEYYLADPTDRDSDGLYQKIGPEIEKNTDLVLVRVVRWIDVNEDNYKVDDIVVKRKQRQICQNVTDLRFDYYLEPTKSGTVSGFVTPALESQRADPATRKALQLDGETYIKEFIYGRYRRGPQIFDFSGQFERGNRNAERGEVDEPFFKLPNDQECPALKIGSEIYVYAQGQNAQFPDGNYTIRNRADDRLYFEQVIDTSAWRANETGLRFKAGYLPSAIRVAVRVLNDEGQEPRRVSQVAYIRAVN